MSYRRNVQALKPVTFEVISAVSGQHLQDLEDADHVLEFANDNIQNPEVTFIGYDETGTMYREWDMSQVLNGTFERDLSA